MRTLRIYLTGRLAIETRQGSTGLGTFSSDVDRVVLSVLVLERRRPVACSEIADALWDQHRPADWHDQVHESVDGLQSIIHQLGLTGTTSVGENHLNSLGLPTDVWVDMEHAHQSMEWAKAAEKKGDAARVLALSTAAAVIGRRPFLPGIESTWVNLRRVRHRTVFIEALLLWATADIELGNPNEAVRMADEALNQEPLHEPGLRVLMRALDAAGSRAKALEVYEDYRVLVNDAHGTGPTRETEELAAALRSPTVHLDALTPREREVALLLADGLTNRQLAERLYISVQTAETHVKRILAKLGRSSRTEVAALIAGRVITQRSKK